jgi:hypothetical protein
VFCRDLRQDKGRLGLAKGALAIAQNGIILNITRSGDNNSQRGKKQREYAIH